MSQHVMTIANQAGAAFRADLNNGLGAIATNNSGATAPATTYAYQWWADTANDLLKQRNSSNTAWISLLTLSTGRPVPTIPVGAAALTDSALGFSMINGTLVASVGSSALTIAIKTKAGADPSAADPVLVLFRNTTAATGDYTVLSLTAATSVVVSSGSTLGATSAVASRVWVVGFNDAGTFRLGVINCRSGFNVFPLGDEFIESSTAEGGAGAADSAGVFYTGTAVTSKAYKILGYVESTQATAGTWATTPSKIQLFGPGVNKPGDVVQERAQQFGTLFATAINIPFDDTIPQITEGGEIFTQPFTARSVLSVLQFDVALGVCGTAVIAEYVSLALFKDATADAFAAGTQSAPNSGVSTPFQAALNAMALAGSTSAATYSVRVGATSGTLTVNGVASLRRLGGVAASSFNIKEIAT